MKKILPILSGVMLIFIDQVIKWWMINYHPSLVYLNRGIVFGFIENQIISLILLFLGIAALIWIALDKKKTQWTTVALIFIAAGALSNIIDRLWHGGVIDYFSIKGLNTFNLADVYIIVGVIIYLIRSLR